MQGLTSLSDDALLHELHVIVGTHRRATAELILHLGEVDARCLHVEKGFSSLFSYCVQQLRFSEDEACRRIEAARLARRFPGIYPLLETAAVSLTVLGLLKPHLTDENHQELLAGVSGSSVRQAKEWLATRFPQPDVPSSVRKLAERHPMMPPPLAAASLSVPSDGVHGAATPLGAPAPASTRITAIESPSQGSLLAPSRASARARIESLSHDRFLVKFTTSRAVRDKLEHARDMMRHANPDGELAVVLERAVDLLIAELEKKKQGRTSRPQKGPRPAKKSHVTRAARREVVGQDGWRCSFVAEDGRRCDARGFLEFDHKIPKGRRGGSEPKNLRVLCQAHNRLAAERVYGKAHMARAISDARSLAGKALTVRDTVATYLGARERPAVAKMVQGAFGAAVVPECETRE